VIVAVCVVMTKNLGGGDVSITSDLRIYRGLSEDEAKGRAITVAMKEAPGFQISNVNCASAPEAVA